MCPPGCSLCEEACRSAGPGKSVSPIWHIDAGKGEGRALACCVQCHEPECLAICPSGALSKSPADGVVRVDKERCVGCGMCTLACRYGGMAYSAAERKVSKCDMCDGDPACVKACPVGALQLLQARKIERFLSDREFLSRGTRACPGCGAELAYRLTQRFLGRYADVAIFGCPGCMTTLMNGFGPMPGSSSTYVSCLFTNVFSTMTGVYRYYRHKNREVKLVAFVGDGCVADVSFQTLSGAAERGEKLVVVCYDNEGYQNTGNQRSSTTPQKARTYTSPAGGARSGKAQTGKDVPLIMVAHNIPYVATATIAFQEDYLRKLSKAMQVGNGLAYIHLLTPCSPGWGSPADVTVDLSRLAVETCHFPLWECEGGEFRFTHEPKKIRPVAEFLGLQGRFSHMKEPDIEQFQRAVDEHYGLLERMVNVWKQGQT